MSLKADSAEEHARLHAAAELLEESTMNPAENVHSGVDIGAAIEERTTPCPSGRRLTRRLGGQSRRPGARISISR